jgi:hypothetical protein
MKHYLWLLLFCWSACTPICGHALSITNAQAKGALSQLDKELTNANKYEALRQASIDSIKAIIAHQTIDSPQWLTSVMTLADSYSSFNADSAIQYYTVTYEHSSALKATDIALAAKIKRATQLPLIGFNTDALNDYNSIPVDSIPEQLLALYYSSGCQMYHYISIFYASYPDIASKWEQKAADSQEQSLRYLDQSSAAYKLAKGEYFFRHEEYLKAKVILEETVDILPDNSNIYARATHMLALIANINKDSNGHLYYLALSAIADIKSATMETASLKHLGTAMHDIGDLGRSHTYLSQALDNAVKCHALVRMFQSSTALSMIEEAHTEEIESWQTRMYCVIGLMTLLLFGVVVVLIMLRHEMKRMGALQHHLETANHAKEVYISQFLNLCSIYMDKLHQFCKIANRKISTGKIDELYRLTKSGKFIEEQSAEFYATFDNAFLHIYPGFVPAVNALLLPDEQIGLKDGELLNTDLRILAFMRLGIDDSNRIAQVLNYSVYTIYTYRNKIKHKAINRDTFEADIMNIKSI